MLTPLREAVNATHSIAATTFPEAEINLWLSSRTRTDLEYEPMAGFLIPEWYRDEPPSEASMRLGLLSIGFFTAVTCFTFVKLLYQTYWFWIRSLKPNEYLVLVWVVWLDAILTTIVVWLFMSGKIEASFWLFFGLVCLLSIEFQSNLNVLIHLMKFLIPCPRQAHKLKWTAVLAQMCIIISVFVVWIPSQMQLSSTFMAVDKIWLKIIAVEVFLVDGALGGYLALLAKRRRDTAKGLNYWSDSFWKILALVSIMSLVDILNVVALSIPDRYFYILFQPTMSMIKVFTGMTIAEVLCKILYPSDSNAAAYGICEDLDSSMTWEGSGPSSFGGGGGQQPLPANWTPDMNWWPWTTFRTTVTSDHTHAEDQSWAGIQKTVETEVRHEWVVLHHRDRGPKGVATSHTASSGSGASRLNR